MRIALTITLACSVLATSVGLAGAAGPGTITTIAEVGHPRDLAALADGALLVAQPFENTVRRVNPDGTTIVVAGTGDVGYSGDGGPATMARLSFVHGVAPLRDGGYVLADTRNDCVRRVAADGTITTIAGLGSAGFVGDGGPAAEAKLWAPHGVGVTANGDVLVADTENHRVRMISTAGIITTVAGTGERGYSGDDGPATLARLDRPFDVAALPAGGFLVADSNRVRRVAPDNTITTVAGSSEAAFSGDGGPANLARLSSPHGVTPLPGGGFLIADTGNQRIRRVFPDGTISTIAGTGTSGFSGDGGAAATASLDSPKAVEMAGEGGSYVIADAGNDRIRLVAGTTAPLVLKIPARVSSKVRTAVRLPVLLSEAAALRLEVKRGSKLVLGVRAVRSAGSSVLVFGRQLKAGRYSLRLRAGTSDGRTGQSVGTLVRR